MVCSCPFLMLKNIYPFSRTETDPLKAGQSLPPTAHVQHHDSQQRRGHYPELSCTRVSLKQVLQRRASYSSVEQCKVVTTAKSSSQEHKTARENQHFPCSPHGKKTYSTNDGRYRTGGASWQGFLKWLPLPWTWAMHSVCLRASSAAELARLWISRL